MLTSTLVLAGKGGAMGERCGCRKTRKTTGSRVCWKERRARLWRQSYLQYLCLRISRHQAIVISGVHKHDHAVHISSRTYLRDYFPHESSRRRPMANGKPVFRRLNCELD